MRKKRHEACLIETGDEAPKLGDVLRHVRRPSRMAIRKLLRRCGVFDAVRMARQIGACGADFEGVAFRAAIESLRGESMRDGDQRDLRLLAKSKA